MRGCVKYIIAPKAYGAWRGVADDSAGFEDGGSDTDRPFQSLHSLQNGRDDNFVAHDCVDHHVIKRTSGPVGAEVVLYEFDAVTVDGVDQLFGFSIAVAYQAQSPNLLRPGSVEEYVEGVRAFAQEIGSAPPDYDAISRGCDPGHDFLSDGHKAIRVKRGRVRHRHGAFVTGAPKCLGQTMKGAVGSLLAARHGGAVDLGFPGDLLSQILVPELPAQPTGQRTGDVGGAASEFPFDGDHSKQSMFPLAVWDGHPCPPLTSIFVLRASFMIVTKTLESKPKSTS